MAPVSSILLLAHLSYAQDELLWSIFVCRPSVLPSVNIFKQLLLWSRWANFAQISYGAPLGWGNTRLLKWSWSVDRDGHHADIWKKPLKFSCPEPRIPWRWIFAQIIGDGRSTKIAKTIVVHWRLTILRQGQVCFPMHLYGHHTFVWEKYWEFQTTSPLKPLGQCCLNFMWSPLGWRMKDC